MMIIYFREGLIRSCWRVDHTKRPTAPEIVDFLATNPRVISPCLDVPLASVQLDNSGQLDLSLPEAIKKFSMSLSWPSQRQPSSTSPLSQFNAEDPLNNLLSDINIDGEINGNIDALLGIHTEDPESSKPLLTTDDRTRPVPNNIKIPVDDHKYVNFQPEKPMPNGSIQLQEESNVIEDHNDDSFL